MLEFVLLAFSSLFVIVDPIAAVPAFLAMTPNDTPRQRIKMAGLACAVAAGMLIVFAWVGNYIFRFLGITMPAFQMAGSIVLLLVALDMLKAQRSRVHETSEETDAGTEKQDIAIAPLAVPMLSGPGAITTAILLHNQAGSSIAKQIALVFCILAVAGVSYVTLRLSAHGAKWLSPIILRLITRIMGLLLVAIAFQFVFNALEAMKGKLF